MHACSGRETIEFGTAGVQEGTVDADDKECLHQLQVNVNSLAAECEVIPPQPCATVLAHPWICR